jgi:hypothetical protein
MIGEKMQSDPNQNQQSSKWDRFTSAVGSGAIVTSIYSVTSVIWSYAGSGVEYVQHKLERTHPGDATHTDYASSVIWEERRKQAEELLSNLVYGIIVRQRSLLSYFHG